MNCFELLTNACRLNLEKAALGTHLVLPWEGNDCKETYGFSLLILEKLPERHFQKDTQGKVGWW